MISLFKSDRLLSRIQDLGYQDNLEVCEYNPDTDKLTIFIGTENDIPPPDILNHIKGTLEDLPECRLLIAPGIFRILVLKGMKE